MKSLFVFFFVLLLSLQADIKTASGKTLNTDNLGVTNIRVW
jgi:hypothetical protein